MTLLVSVFLVGYLFITFEHKTNINKAATALITGVLAWCAYLLADHGTHDASQQLLHQLGEIAGILFFLLGAMTVVELIDAHDGFAVITRLIRTKNKRTLLWVSGIITFFFSAVLDNLTTAILMTSILRKLITDKEDRMYFTGIMVIAANAGGAWSPIGDVTTTMLWIGGQITASSIVLKLFLPSLACLVIPLLLASLRLKGTLEQLPASFSPDGNASRNLILFSGLGVLLFVPMFKTVTHLPPFMGMLLGLGIIWVISETINRSKDTDDADTFSVVHALRKIDTPSILFFLGILLAVSALQVAGALTSVAAFLDSSLGDHTLIAVVFGLASAIVDNVPLVAAVMGMYDLAHFPTDHHFWSLLAYCTGTGGSALIIGSAAGVAVMGMEGISFFWYLKRITWLALAGFFAGAAVIILFQSG